MNLVQAILDQLSPDILGKLSSTLGESEANTKKAVSAGVPSVLSALSAAALNPQMLEKLLALLKNFDLGSMGKIIESLGSGKSGVPTQGADILGSLLGGGGLASIIGALAKYSGIGAVAGKKLLAFLAPMVMGAILGQFKNKPVTAQGLTDLFAEQKSNIAQAMPSGFSLADLKVPAAPTASGLPVWLLPLAGLLLLGGLIYWYFGNQTPKPPVVPPPVVDGGGKPVDTVTPKVEPTAEGTKFAEDLSKLYTTATETLSGITDAASADAAEPKLKTLLGSIDALKPIWDKLPDTAKSAVAAVQAKGIEPLKTLVAKVLALPVVGDKLKPILDEIVAKMSAFGG